MKIKGLIIPVVTCLAVMATPAMAETKVGVVNTVRLMEEAPQAKAAQSELESEFSSREKELVGLQKGIRKLEDQLSTDAAVMSEDESNKLERKILSKRRESKRLQDEFRDDLNIRKTEVLSKLQKQMYNATVGLAKQEKYDVILGQGVVYSSATVDITDKVLVRLKKEFKSGGK